VQAPVAPTEDGDEDGDRDTEDQEHEGNAEHLRSKRPESDSSGGLSENGLA